jgi:hypothetical protein
MNERGFISSAEILVAARALHGCVSPGDVIAYSPIR